jgi:MinD superfamily P-loop ATPase
MQELVIISGKGGTGKTSLVASFAVLADSHVLADCDVETPDLHLVLQPEVRRQGIFSGSSRARIKTNNCIACGRCQELCRFGAILYDGPGNARLAKTYRVDPIACEGCGVCAYFCEHDAIQFGPVENGRWFISDTRCGPMVHARLGIAEESSGKLVHLVRSKAAELATRRMLDLVIIDGAPGVACPVIASITAANLVLVVTEPTRSAIHDLQRVLDLAESLTVPALVVINKWDLNTELCAAIRSKARARNVEVAGQVCYDNRVTSAQIQGQSIVEYASDGAAADIRRLWSVVFGWLRERGLHPVIGREPGG